MLSARASAAYLAAGGWLQDMADSQLAWLLLVQQLGVQPLLRVPILAGLRGPGAAAAGLATAGDGAAATAGAALGAGQLAAAAVVGGTGACCG